MKRILGTLLFLLLIAGNCLTCFAAPSIMDDDGVFDAKYYAANNPDVVAALGTDENVLYMHYVNNGCKEGRLPYDPQDEFQVTLLLATKPMKAVAVNTPAPVIAGTTPWSPLYNDYTAKTPKQMEAESYYFSIINQVTDANIIETKTSRKTYVSQRDTVTKLASMLRFNSGMVQPLEVEQLTEYSYKVTKVEKNSPTQYTYYIHIEEKIAEDTFVANPVIVVDYKTDMTLSKVWLLVPADWTKSSK